MYLKFWAYLNEQWISSDYTEQYKGILNATYENWCKSDYIFMATSTIETFLWGEVVL